MKIAFDLDDTLIQTTTTFSVGTESLCFPFNLYFKEPLRSGTIRLLKELKTKHEVWIYTTSLRPAVYIKTLFWIQGIRLDGVINANSHQSAVSGTQYQHLTKAPKLFGIDVLIDDAAGVVLECQKQQSLCIHIAPDDKNWVNTILTKLPQ